MTVGELIEKLNEYDKEEKIYLRKEKSNKTFTLHNLSVKMITDENVYILEGKKVADGESFIN